MELEQKQKEEEAQVEQLEVAAHKKANAIAQVLSEGRTGCGLCLQLGELILLLLLSMFLSVCLIV